MAANSRIGQALRSWRGAQGLEQADVAKLLGVSRQSVSLWETGNTMPHAKQLERLRAVMGSYFPTLGHLPAIPVEEVLDAAKAALDAWWLDYRAQIVAAAYNTPPEAPAQPDGSGNIEATAMRAAVEKGTPSRSGGSVPAAKDAAPIRRRK